MTNKMHSRVFLLLFLLPAIASAAPVWESLQPDGFITDAADLLSPEEEQTLEADLGAFRQSSGNEIAVVTIPLLAGSPIEEVALALGRRWGVGQKDRDSGVLLLVAQEDRELRIEVGYGLEGSVPDAIANRIIEDIMVPKFREGQFGVGIQAGVTAVKDAIVRDGDVAITEQADERIPIQSYVFLLLWLTFIFGGFLAATRSWWLGGVLGGVIGVLFAAMTTWWVFIPALIVYGLGIDYFFSKLFPRHFRRGGMWLGGPGGGGSISSGGFGGFGGGSFGGGGASGRW